MRELRGRVDRVEGLVRDLESIPDAALRVKVQDLVALLLELYGEGLERLLARLAGEGEAGRSKLLELARDEVVGSLLLLHGLHPLDLETRVREALEGVRPYLASHGGNVELVGCADSGEVRLRLEGSCHGCPSSAATLKGTIEEAIRTAAPDVTSVLVETAATELSP